MLAPTSALLAHIDIPPKLLASLIVLGICLLIWFFKAILSSPAKPPQAPPPGPPGQNPWGAPPPGHNPYAQHGQPPPPGANPWGAPPPPQGHNPYGQPQQPQQQQQAPQGYNPYAQQPPPPQQAMAQPQVPFCGQCGGPGRWLPEANAWGCDRCRQLIQPR